MHRIASWRVLRGRGAVLVTAAVVIGSGLLTAPAAPTGASAAPREAGAIAHSADTSHFSAGNIVSDEVFFNSATMTVAQVQSFLEAKVPACEAGYTCLRDWYDTTRSTATDAMCSAYPGGGRERASTIIYEVARACGINPQVILVTLQKEQGLVTHTGPSESRYRIAMGQGCPDTAACDSQYYGFFNQVFGAAWQFKRYANPPGTSQYFTWYAPGNTWNVRYHPNQDCGSAPVYVQNQATANLYYYTPYQPNQAALSAGYGEGDGCSSYGNRNFFNYFTDWFGSSTSSGPCAAPPEANVTAASGEYYVDVDELNGRAAPSTACNDGLRTLTRGTILTRTGTYGVWWQVRLDGAVFWVHSDYLAPSPAAPYTTSRLAGADRYATSVAVSHAGFPGRSPTVYIASGQDFPDALGAAAVAAASGSSVLLSMRTALPDPVRTELVRLRPTMVVLVGGEGALAPDVADAVSAALPGVQVTRIAGADRYETSRALAASAYRSASTVFLATGQGFADALSASATAGAIDAPVVLVRGGDQRLDAATEALVRSLGTTTVIIAGGTASVSTGMESGLRSSGIAVTRYGGANRYQTSQLLNAGIYSGAVPVAYLATGVDFPDALSGAMLAGLTAAPLFSQPPTCMTGPAKDYFIAHGTKTVTLVGGQGALGEAVSRSERC